MKEIRCRGKRVGDGRWVHGWYVKANGHWHNKGIHEDWIICHAIQNGGWFALGAKYPVIPETVGQSTGLKDGNGVEIYGGDVVSNGYTIIYSTGQERRFDDVGVVRYDTKNGCLVINNDDGRTKRLTVKVIKENRVKVIGNIHDNPELVG